LSGDKWEGSVKRSTLQLKSGYVPGPSLALPNESVSFQRRREAEILAGI
jgi:hypothetical protein